MKFPCLYLFALTLPFSLSAATMWHVDAHSGSDKADGRTPAHALRTIQSAIDRTEPGDTVKVHPGVYHESVRITRRGTADAPIVLSAADSRPGTVIISGAVPGIRNGKVTWELVDPDTHLYRTPHAAGWPARVLYDNVDLYPYATLAALKTFQNPNAPGPLHGYFYDGATGHLYLRLHPRHAQGRLNPADHIIAVAPSTGEGFEGTIVTHPSHYGIGILGESPAHIRIEGFTFETPGIAGIYAEASDVIISDSWFYGCRTAVSGNYQETVIDPEKSYDFKNLRHDPATLDRIAARVTLRRCFFTQYPTFEDIRDCIDRLTASLPEGRSDRLARYGAMWQRKSVGNGLPSELFKYEIGIACRIGRDWTIEDSVIVSAFEGLSCHAVAGSENLTVRRNLFARLADNAIETEDWSQGMTVTENLILDVFEPISWQPLRGLPWPTNIVISRNLIANTPANADYWKPVFPGRGVFKIGASLSNWRALASMADVPPSPITLGGRGIDISHNLVYFPGGRLFTLIGDRKVPIPEIRLHDNLLATDFLFDVTRNPKNEMRGDHFTLTRNLAVPSRPGASGPGLIAAGREGQVAADLTALGLTRAEQLDFRPSATNEPTSKAFITPPESLLSPPLLDGAEILAHFDFSLPKLPYIPWPPSADNP